MPFSNPSFLWRKHTHRMVEKSLWLLSILRYLTLLKTNNLNIFFPLKKSTSHCVGTFCSSTNASFEVGKWLVLLCPRIGPPCILGSSIKSVMFYVMFCALYANASSCAKLGTKLPTPPITWAATFESINTILKPTMTKWAILHLFSFSTYLISSPF